MILQNLSRIDQVEDWHQITRYDTNTMRLYTKGQNPRRVLRISEWTELLIFIGT